MPSEEEAATPIQYSIMPRTIDSHLECQLAGLKRNRGVEGYVGKRNRLSQWCHRFRLKCQAISN